MQVRAVRHKVELAVKNDVLRPSKLVKASSSTLGPPRARMLGIPASADATRAGSDPGDGTARRVPLVRVFRHAEATRSSASASADCRRLTVSPSYDSLAAGHGKPPIYAPVNGRRAYEDERPVDPADDARSAPLTLPTGRCGRRAGNVSSAGQPAPI